MDLHRAPRVQLVLLMGEIFDIGSIARFDRDLDLIDALICG
jgi:hypothetical protein